MMKIAQQKRDIENDVDDKTFQRTFVNKTIKDSLKISIHAYLDKWYYGYIFLLSPYFMESHLFPKKDFI